jgi:hypothetical protein
MHFLTKITETPQFADPVKNAPDVHKHFTRYSRGLFDGPVVKISIIGKKISIGASFEYEDACFQLAITYFPEESMVINGVLLSGMNFTNYLKGFQLDSDWVPEKSKGQTQNYTTSLKGVKISKELINKLSVKWSEFLYALLSFSSTDKEVALTMKPKPPRPNSKNPEDSNPANLIKFCSLKLPNSPEILKAVIDSFAKDFKDEIPIKWKSLTLSNSYEITDLLLPSDKNLPSNEIRIQTIRKGILHRVLEVDGKSFKNNIQFSV